MNTLIIALITGMVFASSVIYLGFDLAQNKAQSFLYKKNSFIRFAYDAYTAVKAKKSELFFEEFEKPNSDLMVNGKRVCEMTRYEYIESLQVFKKQLKKYKTAIEGSQSLETIDAQPQKIDEMKKATLEVIEVMEEIRLYIQELHLQGVNSTLLSGRSKENARRIADEESRAFQAINSLTPRNNNDDDNDRQSQRPQRNNR